MIDSQQIGETAQKCPMHPSSSFPQWWHLTSHHSQKSDTGPMCVQFSALLNTRVAWHEDHCNRITAYSITTKISLCSQAHTPTTPNPGHPVVCSPSLQCWHAENDIEVESRSPWPLEIGSFHSAGCPWGPYKVYQQFFPFYCQDHPMTLDVPSFI